MELVSLNELNERSNSFFLFDGTLCYGVTKKYIQSVPFEFLSIGEYDNLSSHTVGKNIWIQSIAGKSRGIWYCLRIPTKEYARFHMPFLWLADLSKHLVDYLSNNHMVHLMDLRRSFYMWLDDIHGNDQSFRLWFNQYNDFDFRRAVAAHASFLFNQAGVLDRAYISHPLWSEIDPLSLTAVPRQDNSELRTIVTPFVFKCFRHMPWSRFLKTLDSLTSEPEKSAQPLVQHFMASDTEITIGDVIAVQPDPNTDWKNNDQLWYAYVQRETMSKRGQQLGLLWLYKPSDTACQNQKYPFPNELFLSDHCNCKDTPIYSTEVVSKHRVEFFGDPASNSEFFVRQKYNEAEPAWVSLQDSDFQCCCDTDPPEDVYDIGDTVLIKECSPNFHIKESLEPVIIEGLFDIRKHHSQVRSARGRSVRVRRLLRRQRDYFQDDAEPNELVYTNMFATAALSDIVRRCHIRFYAPRNKGNIPAPYCRKGTSDCYYIMYRSLSNSFISLEPLSRPWPLMKQGFDPLLRHSKKPLNGLDIFCGGGNFGRGIEEGGAVKYRWAVDWFREAIHTYKANMSITDDTKLYFGSVNDFLAHAIKSKRQGLIAQKGEVEFISAGNPCQGYSIANRCYQTDQSLRNNSMVASVLAYIDFYRPKYAIMENVLGMTSTRPKRTDNDVFAQVLCTLVALGYQVRPHILDSWSFGAPQKRTRLFVSVAAAGLPPLIEPPASHSHPEAVLSRSLGKTANGLPFAARSWCPTPLKYTTIGEATKDLPENHDARAVCVTHPDHRVTTSHSFINQVRLSNIPRFPPGMNFVKSAKIGWQSLPQMNDWHWNSNIRSSISLRAWQRVVANALAPTVVTTCSPGEALTGSVLHWDANRTLTVMEARIAQGFPDHEVIVGSPAMQWKIIGNSVSRQVATAWGMSVRAAWFGDDAMRQVQDSSNPSYLESGNEDQEKDKCDQEIKGSVKNEDKNGDEDDDENELAKAVTTYNSRVIGCARIISQPINSRTPTRSWILA